jgi:hypothetical protein
MIRQRTRDPCASKTANAIGTPSYTSEFMIDDDHSLDRCIGLHFESTAGHSRANAGTGRSSPAPNGRASRRGEYRPEECVERASVRRSAGGGAVPRPREPMDRLRFKARSARRQGLTGVTGRVALPLRTPRSASRIKRDHRPPVFSTGGSPHQSILHSQDRSIPLLAGALNDESSWDTGTFEPRGGLSAIWETIRRADLPEPVTPA